MSKESADKVIDFEFEYLTVSTPSYFRGVSTRKDYSTVLVGIGDTKAEAASDAVDNLAASLRVPDDVLDAMVNVAGEFSTENLIPDVHPDDEHLAERPHVYVGLHVKTI